VQLHAPIMNNPDQDMVIRAVEDAILSRGPRESMQPRTVSAIKSDYATSDWRASVSTEAWNGRDTSGRRNEIAKSALAGMDKFFLALIALALAFLIRASLIAAFTL
jgi:hypothetical protein